jgi:hypothetical protein
MAAVSDVIPSMLQGISQQAPELRLPIHGEIQWNAVSSPVHGLGKRAGTRHIRTLGFTVPTTPEQMFRYPKVHWIDRDRQERYTVSIQNQTIRVFDLTGTAYPVSTTLPPDDAYLACESDERDLQMLTINDTTLVLNRTKQVKMDSTQTDAAQTKFIVWIRAVGYGVKYTIRLNGTDYSYQLPDGDPVSEVVDVRTSKVALELKTLIAAAGYTVTHTAEDSVFWVDNPSGHNVEVKDSNGNRNSVLINGYAKVLSDLPPKAPTNYVVKILGGEDVADDYWVRFDPVRSAGSKAGKRGEWIECPRPQITYRFDSRTLPHQLVRKQNPDGSIYFEYSAVTWGERLVGGGTTNPQPTFVPGYIRSMFLVQNRLGFLSGANVCLSAVDDLFNFWRTTTLELIDSDRLDYNVSANKVTDLFHTVVTNDQLLLISDKAQLSVPLSDGLSPATFSALTSSTYPVSTLCEPPLFGSTVLLPQSDGQYTNFLEYDAEGDTRLKVGNELTMHVKRYMAGEPLSVAVCEPQTTAFVLTTGNRSVLYVYGWQGPPRGRVQNSWGHWSFDGSVLSVGVYDSRLYMLIWRPEGVCLEVVEIDARRLDGLMPFPVLLDRRVVAGSADTDIYQTQIDTGIRRATETNGTGGVLQARIEQEGGDPTALFSTPGGLDPSTVPSIVDLYPGGGGGGDPGGGGGDPGGGGGEPTNTGGVGPQPEDPTTTQPGNRTTTVTLPWTPIVGRTVVIRGDSGRVVPWTAGAGRAIIIDSDAPTVYYIGNTYEFRYRFGPAAVLKQTLAGGIATKQTGILQVLRWTVDASYAGPFVIEVRRKLRSVAQKLCIPRRVGQSPVNGPAAHTGQAPVLAKAEEARVDLVNSTPVPSWFSTARWEGELSREYSAL